jgi:hypothetical protein
MDTVTLPMAPTRLSGDPEGISAASQICTVFYAYERTPLSHRQRSLRVGCSRRAPEPVQAGRDGLTLWLQRCIGLVSAPAAIMQALSASALGVGLIIGTALHGQSRRPTGRARLRRRAARSPGQPRDLLHHEPVHAGRDQFADRVNVQLVLIDGPELANLMIDHNCGMVAEHTFTLKHVERTSSTMNERLTSAHPVSRCARRGVWILGFASDLRFNGSQVRAAP